MESNTSANEINNQESGKKTSLQTRSEFVWMGLLASLGLLIMSLTALLDKEPMIPILSYIYIAAGVAGLSCIAQLKRCVLWDNHIQTPTYRLGVFGRSMISLAVMVLVYGLSYNIKGLTLGFEASQVALVIVMAVIATVQVSCPAEDVNIPFVAYTIVTGDLFFCLGIAASKSHIAFLYSICCFPVALALSWRLPH